MSADTRPITPTRFAAALKELSLPTLHLKVLEIRNSIAHLQYSNVQLQPFADGTEVPVSADSSAPPATGVPDQDCIDAIRENEVVIERMRERIALVRAEIEGRGFSWNEFKSKEELESEQTPDVNGDAAAPATTNGDAREAQQTGAPHPAWSDGTFQTGTIRNGELHMDESPRRPGGSLTDEELARAMAERMRELGADPDGEDEEGVHL